MVLAFLTWILSILPMKIREMSNYRTPWTLNIKEEARRPLKIRSELQDQSCKIICNKGVWDRSFSLFVFNLSTYRCLLYLSLYFSVMLMFLKLFVVTSAIFICIQCRWCTMHGIVLMLICNNNHCVYDINHCSMILLFSCKYKDRVLKY